MALPKYEITIDPEYSEGEDLGINQVAFVKNPAVKVKGVAFTNDQEKQMFFADKNKQRIVAPAMIPMEIYRNDSEEYYVEFTESEIDKIHSKLMKKMSKGKFDLFNLEHDSNQTVPAYLLETWKVDNPELDKSFSTYGIKVPKGTLMMVAQVTDKQYYNDLVANDQVGFSIEGFLGMKIEDYNNKKQNEVTMNETGMILPDGEWTIEDKIYTIKDGVVVDVKDVEVPVEEVAMAEEVVVEEEAPVEEVIVEEEMSNDVPATSGETAPAEVKMAIDETELMAILAPKFDEIYKMIADIKNEEIVEDMVEENMVPVELTSQERFAQFVAFSRKNK
jgi:hypothetical protein